MSISFSKLTLLTSTCALIVAACTAGAGTDSKTGDGDSRDGDSGDGDICLDCGDGDSGDGDGTIDPNINLPPTPNCGDGVLDDDEVCDDGAKDDGDGCYGNCRGIDVGYICPKPGEPCIQFAVCGDGVTAFPEQCDDGGVAEGDGCNDNCKLELGFKCTTDGVSVCTETTCGDNLVEGAEMCEPSQTEGCTSQCQFAPQCGGSGACTSECGDGLVLGEDCDDGNLLNGDGCDSQCKVEDGYTCDALEGDCLRNAAGDCILRIPVTYRDFDASHSDFESGCAGDVATTGILNPTLDSSGKPSATGTVTNMCTTGFADWYVDSANSTTFHSELVLYDDGDGNFVNRWGKNGERWYTKLGWDGGTNCTVAPHCGPFDGNPFFFPVDGIPNARGDVYSLAAVSTFEYGMDNTSHSEQSLTGAATMHNFSFTSEVAYWFAYEDTTDATLSFSGDDDVWVYANGKLALDLGGLHQALAGTVAINSGTAATYGLTAGNVYEIKVFHAERHTTGSTFKLTLSGFNTTRSDCEAFCGDGIIGVGEQCDDGVNDGGYNECGAECKLGSYCGNGVVDEGEVCDDADPNAPAECNGCRIIVVR